MRHRSLAISLSLLWFLSACSGSNSGDDNAAASNNDSATITSGNSSDGIVSEEPMPGTSGVLNSDNVDAVIMQAFEIYSGRAYDRRMTDFPYIEKVAVQFQEPQYNEFNDALIYRSLSCNNEGNVSETSSEAYQPLLVNSLYTNLRHRCGPT